MADMSLSEARREKAMNRYPRLEAELDSRGGYAAEAEAKRMSANLGLPNRLDRKSTRLNSSHVAISYAVFCVKKKKRRKQCARTDAAKSQCAGTQPCPTQSILDT